MDESDQSVSDYLPRRGLALAWRRLTTGSASRRIFGAAMTVAVLTALVKAVTVGRELIVAWRFGTSDALDAFLIALVVPSFIINIVAGSFNAAFIPTFIRVRRAEDERAAQRLLSSVMVWSTGLLILTTVLMLVAAPLYLPLLARGFSAEKLRLTRRLLYACAPMVLLNGMVVIWGAVLNAGERFALAALVPAVTPIASVILLLAFPSWGVFALAAGLVCGAALEMLMLGTALKRQDTDLRPRWHGFDPHLRQVARQYLPMMAGAFLMSGTYLVDQSMATMLAPGSVAALNYGNRVVTLALALAATGLGTALIPYWSDVVARNEWAEVRRTLRRYLWLIFGLTVPLVILLIACSRLLVRLLFQRGAFTAEDAEEVSRTQQFYALQIPFYLAGILVVRLISAMRANHILLWAAAINLTVNVVLNYLFMRWLGVAGIALSTSVVYLVSFIYCQRMLGGLLSAAERERGPEAAPRGTRS